MDFWIFASLGKLMLHFLDPEKCMDEGDKMEIFKDPFKRGILLSSSQPFSFATAIVTFPI